MTYRERREARAARLREWAEKRAVKAESAHTAADSLASMIPMGQPILVGHHSEGKHRRDLDRINGRYDKAHEHAQMAQSMTSRADSIEAAAAHAIYSDDPDAIERLREKLAGLVAESDRMKAYNKSVKAGAPDESLLDEHQRERLASTRRVAPYMFRKDGTLPASTNLAANINRTRARLAEMKR